MAGKHTAGPWAVVEHSWSDIGVYASEHRVCLLSIYDEATEETQSELEARDSANARLIAAAPELLEALWVATEHNALHFGERHNTVIQGRAAILKATGEGR